MEFKVRLNFEGLDVVVGKKEVKVNVRRYW